MGNLRYTYKDASGWDNQVVDSGGDLGGHTSLTTRKKLYCGTTKHKIDSYLRINNPLSISGGGLNSTIFDC